MGGNGVEEESIDFYQVLGLNKGCTQTELKNAYKKLAMRWHPDRCSAFVTSYHVDDAKNKFQAILEAYFESSPLHTTTIVEKCTLKLVDEYKHMLCQATEPLSTFLEDITFGHMIDNLVLIVTGTLHERDVQELLEKCHQNASIDIRRALYKSMMLTEVQGSSGLFGRGPDGMGPV